jgi:hypothetical protein
MSCAPELEPDGGTVAQSIRMLKEVIDGDTYEAVAARFGVSRTAVERRIKAIAVQLSQVADIDGLNEDGAAFVRRLRLHRDAILTALVDFDPRKTVEHRSSRIISMDEIIQAGKRIKGRSNRAWHDLSLFYLLFATGARPLEIARTPMAAFGATPRCVPRWPLPERPAHCTSPARGWTNRFQTTWKSA